MPPYRSSRQHSVKFGILGAVSVTVGCDLISVLTWNSDEEKLLFEKMEEYFYILRFTDWSKSLLIQRENAHY